MEFSFHFSYHVILKRDIEFVHLLIKLFVFQKMANV